mmetsp:Transcript_60358/g.118748  ORF Transcript_60358/g.118748 Transcript_60358/m.118748 type:complete len:338 (+) Transcript_60358:1-1014(+)
MLRGSLVKALVRSGIVGCSAWIFWYRMVLRHAAKQARPWGPRRLIAFLSGRFFKLGCWYLNYSDNCEEVVKEGTFGQGAQYLIVWHPHGAFTLSAFVFFSHYWAIGYPGDSSVLRYVCIAPLLLRIPFLSEYLLMCNARSQDSKTFSSLLRTGATVAVQPGGLIEQVSTDHEREQVFFPARLGFVRLAIQNGVPLLPLYGFGENQLFGTSPWTRRANMWLYKHLKFGTLFVLSASGWPNPFLWPISGRGVHLRFGEPVDVGPKEEHPSDERVQEVYQRYVAALQKLFDRYKDDCLPPEVAARGLKVVYRGDERDGQPSSSPSASPPSDGNGAGKKQD